MNFIVIDDSKLDCFIAEKIIRTSGSSKNVRSFLLASEALNHIKSSTINADEKTIVLVDIQMPIMNGFDFVEEFEKLNNDITSSYFVYIISSSINENDLNRVNNYSSVIQFINKPLTSNNLRTIIDSLKSRNLN